MPRRSTRAQGGFTLLEAMVALAIVAMVVLSYIGVRTTALVDATEARNWRLAREIAEEKLSELVAGARELPAESGTSVDLEKYPGFRFEILIGESAVSQIESDLASADGASGDTTDRLQWRQDRNTYRRASERGLSYFEYQEQLQLEEYERQRQEKAPSEAEFEDVAVVVYFPKTSLDEEGEDSFVLKAKVSTLALSGLTPDQAQMLAESRGQTVPEGGLAPGSGSGGGDR